MAEAGSALPVRSVWSCCCRGQVVLGRARPTDVHAEGIEGEPSFTDLARGSDAKLDAAIAGFQEAFTWWRRNDIVSIAAVQGHGDRAGFQLALACDLRVVADDVQFAMRETSLGLVPDLAGTHPLVGLVGRARALEICATGRFVAAEEAVSTGLANISVPREQLDDTVRTWRPRCWPPPGRRDRDQGTAGRGVGRTYDEQRAAERAAQARRIRDLAGVGE